MYVQTLQLFSVSKANHLSLHSCISELVWPAGSRDAQGATITIIKRPLFHLPFSFINENKGLYIDWTNFLLEVWKFIFIFLNWLVVVNKRQTTMMLLEFEIFERRTLVNWLATNSCVS